MAKKQKHRYSSARKRRELHGQRQSQTVQLPDGMSFFQIQKAGARFLDILPYEVKVATSYCDVGDLHYEKTFFVHNQVGPNNDRVICPRKTFDEACPICEAASRLQKDPDADEDFVKGLWPRERQLWLVVDVKDRDKGVMVWDVSYHLFGKQLDDFLGFSDEEDNYDRFYFLDDGLTVKVGFTEKTFAGRAYYEMASIEMRERQEQYPDEVLVELPSLDDLIIHPTYEELAKLFDQEEESAAEEQADEEESPKRRLPTRPKAPSNPKEPEDVEEEAPWDDEEEDELPPPKKPRVKRDPPKATSNGDDDDNWDEFDED